ncbi:hypothetical protein TNCV_4721481 [Trichonephila clavipes]|uniref:Uncharacterized protein n=1 Tax=Trichonephila clavipes TaxID=2585209 RepID=A0A8X6W6J2_TRICX|nr:hypothetical protein TNCV_4721481 [Trichonephila clavipes]
MAKFEEKYSCKKRQDSRNSDNARPRGWISVGCLMMTIDGGIGEIRKFDIDRVMAEKTIGVITSLVIKEIRGSKAGMNLIGMIEDLMIKDTPFGK